MVTEVSALASDRGLKISRRVSRVFVQIGLYAILALLATLFMFPYFWTVTSSLKTITEVYVFPPLWFPKVAQWDNYLEVFRILPFGRWFLNSLIVVALSTTGVVVTCSLVAYSFARFRWHGRDLFFMLILSTMMIPSEVTLIPQYILFKQLHWLNTIRPLWIPSWFGGGAFNIFLMRQFYMTIPREFDEAALIDGASYLKILLSVLLPLLKPVLATVMVLNFMGAWNDFMGPLIYLNSPQKFTLALGMRYFSATRITELPKEHQLMACCVMSTTPCIILFFFAQRYFVQGIVMSGIKG